MRLLQSANILNGPVSFKVPAGQYAALFLRVSGTNQAGQTLTLANLGRLTITWRGIAVANLTFADLNQLNALIGGAIETATAAGGAFTHSAAYHSSLAADGNVFDITEDDDLYVSVDLSGVTGVIVASGTIALFGVHADGVQAYFPKLLYIQANVPASGTYPYQLQADNITHIMLTGLTNVSRLQVTVDRQVRVFGTLAELQAFTNYNSRVETAIATALLLPLSPSGELSESLSDDINVQIEAGGGGAATPNVVYASIDFSPDILARSKATIQNKQAVNMARKAALGKGRATKVVSTVGTRNLA